jgi:hypothetical protein
MKEMWDDPVRRTHSTHLLSVCALSGAVREGHWRGAGLGKAAPCVCCSVPGLKELDWGEPSDAKAAVVCRNGALVLAAAWKRGAEDDLSDGEWVHYDDGAGLAASTATAALENGVRQ